MREVSQSRKPKNLRIPTASFAILILVYALATLLFTEIHFSATTTGISNGTAGGGAPLPGLSPPSSSKDFTYSSASAASTNNSNQHVGPSILRQPVHRDTRNATPPKHHSVLMKLTSSANLGGGSVGGQPPKRQGRPSVWDVLDDLDHQYPTAAQFLLNFAIIGNGKCGTTSLQLWLAHHPEIFCPEPEILQLSTATVKDFIKKLYRELPSSSWLPPSPPPTEEDQADANFSTAPVTAAVRSRGYKNPGEIRVPHAVRALATHFPQTVLIVGIRHPVLWFQSMYNFKVQNLPKSKPATYWGHPNSLIGKCGGPLDFNCVGTHKGLFHLYLAYLGKTNRTDEFQEQYPDVWAEDSITVTPNPVFLFDVQQMQDGMMLEMPTAPADERSRRNSSVTIHGDAADDAAAARRRGLQFRRDVQAILQLRLPLGPPPEIKPGKTWVNSTLQRERDRNKMDICRDEFRTLRTHLMETSRRASVWIRTSGFLDSPTVHVSSRAHLEEEILAKQWMRDPCG